MEFAKEDSSIKCKRAVACETYARISVAWGAKFELHTSFSYGEMKSLYENVIETERRLNLYNSGCTTRKTEPE